MTKVEKDQETLYFEKRELVFRSYEKSLDLEIALTIVPLSNVEREKLFVDEELEARIMVLDAKNREDMMVDLRDLSKGALSEGVRFSALKELGKTYYPKRFKDLEVVERAQRVIRYEIVEAE